MLRGCLESLLQQPQGVPFEIVVVDNDSSDGAADMVARDFPHVRLIRNSSNVGFSRANNQAATDLQDLDPPAPFNAMQDVAEGTLILRQRGREEHEHGHVIAVWELRRLDADRT